MRVSLHLNEHLLIQCLCANVWVTFSVDGKDAPSLADYGVRKKHLDSIAELGVPAFSAKVVEESLNLEVGVCQCLDPTLDQSHLQPS